MPEFTKPKLQKVLFIDDDSLVLSSITWVFEDLSLSQENLPVELKPPYEGEELYVFLKWLIANPDELKDVTLALIDFLPYEFEVLISQIVEIIRNFNPNALIVELSGRLEQNYTFVDIHRTKPISFGPIANLSVALRPTAFKDFLRSPALGDARSPRVEYKLKKDGFRYVFLDIVSRYYELSQNLLKQLGMTEQEILTKIEPLSLADQLEFCHDWLNTIGYQVINEESSAGLSYSRLEKILKSTSL